MTADEFDPLRLIKKIFGKTELSKSIGSASASNAYSTATQPVSRQEPVKGSKAQLLAALECLPDRGRIRKMVELGKLAALSGEDSNEAQSLIDQLGDGRFYERRLALFANYAAKNADAVMAACRDRSAVIRKLAINMCIDSCSSEQVAQIAEELRFKSLKKLLFALRRKRKLSVIDALFQKMREQRQAALVLPFCSPELVNQEISTFCLRMTVCDFRRLARMHGRSAAAYLLSAACKSHADHWRFPLLFNASIADLAFSQPDQALEIVGVAAECVPLGCLKMAALVLPRPAAVLELFMKHQALNLIARHNLLWRVDVSLLTKLHESHGLPESLVRHSFRKLPPEARDELFSRVGLSWRDERGMIDPRIIEQLSRPTRIAEARRILQLVPTSQFQVRSRYLSFLPWQEVVAECAPLLKDYSSGDRLAALSCLIKTVTFHRDALPELLDFVANSGYGSPDFAAECFRRLSQLPCSVWRTDHLESLSELIRDACQSCRSSNETFRQIAKLILKLLPRHRQWAGTAIASLLRQTAPQDAGTLASILPRLHGFGPADVAALDAALAEFVEEQTDSGEPEFVIAITRWFGPRLQAARHVSDALCRIARVRRNSALCLAAVEPLWRWNRRAFADTVPLLLEEDASWCQTEPVRRFLNLYRQDLLSVFRTQSAQTGVFASRRRRDLLDFNGGFHRWTTEQLTWYAAELGKLITGAPSSATDKIFASRRLCQIPEPPLDTLLELARLDSKQPALRDYAIRQFGLLDNARTAVPVLMECLKDERAAPAAYALSKISSALPTCEILSLAKNVHARSPLHEAIIHMTGDMCGRDAKEALVSRYLAETAAAELKGAAIKTLWVFSSDEDVWDIFDDIVRTAHPGLVSHVAAIPVRHLPGGVAARRLPQLLAGLLKHNDAAVRRRALCWMLSSGVRDSGKVILSDVLSGLRQPESSERRLAARAFFSLYSLDEEQATEQAILGVLKNRRYLVDFLEELRLARSFCGSAKFVGVTRAVLRCMWSDPVSTGDQVRIGCSGLPAADLLKFLLSLDQSARLHCGVVLAVVEACQTGSMRLSLDEIDRLERSLFNKKSEGLRRIGLSLLQLSAQRSGWTHERVARLNSYRKDTSMLVASCAEFVLPADELG